MKMHKLIKVVEHDADKCHVFSFEISADGINSFSGQILARSPHGAAIPVDILGLLNLVYEAGREAGRGEEPPK